MGTDIAIQRRELAREAKRIAEEEEAKRIKKEKDDREIEELQEMLRVKVAAKAQAEAEEEKNFAIDQGTIEDGENQEVDGEEEVIYMDSASDDDNDDRRRIPVSPIPLYVFFILINVVY
jgi:hypothetical protein